MPAPRSRVEIVGFGAGAHDYFRPVGEVDDDHTPGAKAGWTDREDDLLRELVDARCESHTGGNALNVLAYLALKSTVTRRTSFVSALGQGSASDAIRQDLEMLGVRSLTTQSDEYCPSVSIVERRAPGSDRMVRGRPRTPLDAYISDVQIAGATADADVVIAASLKSAALADRVFDLAPADAFTSYNPGSSEFADPGVLRDLMQKHRPNLLALNDEELIQLTEADPTADPVELVMEANRYADWVLYTMGRNGLLLSYEHKVIHHPADTVPSDKVVDTLGAGDRAHAIALDGIYARHEAHEILRDIARGTAALVQHTGAHGDLYGDGYPNPNHVPRQQ